MTWFTIVVLVLGIVLGIFLTYAWSVSHFITGVLVAFLLYGFVLFRHEKPRKQKLR